LEKNIAEYVSIAVVFHSVVSLLTQVGKDLNFRVDS